MQSFFQNIGLSIVSLGIAISSFFGFNAPIEQKPEILGGTLPIAGTTYNLAGSGISSSATSITLQSLTIPQTGQKLIDSDFSSTFYVTLEPGNRTKQEIASCTTVVQNSNNTATLSGCSRGLSPISPYTASTTLQFPHAGAAQVVFSDPPQLFNQYTAKDNNETVSGLYTFSGGSVHTASSTFTSTLNLNGPTTITNASNITSTGSSTFNGIVNVPYATASTSVASVGYANALAFAGAPDASATSKGVVQEATVSDVNSSLSTGSTGAKLFMTPATYAVSNFASSTSVSTTSNVSMGTTTLTFSKPNYNFINIGFRASTTATLTNNPLCFYFNGESTGTNYAYRMNNLNNSTLSGGGNDALNRVCVLNAPVVGDSLFINLNLDNRAGFPKMGHMTFGEFGTSVFKETGEFYWGNTAQITSVSFTTSSTTALFSAGTIIQVSGN